MDKITQYAELIENLLREQPDLLYTTNGGKSVETHEIFDRVLCHCLTILNS